MAGKDKDKENEEDIDKKTGGSNTIKIIIIAVLLAIALVGGGVGATWYFMSGNTTDKSIATKDGKATQDKATQDKAEDTEKAEVAEKEKGPVIYMSLDPKFVVSFNDQSQARFMQLSVDVMMHNSDVKDQIKANMPAIRSSLLMLVGEQKVSDVDTKAGKQKLLKAIAADINATLKKMEGDKAIKNGVENAYFDSFIVQ